MKNLWGLALSVSFSLVFLSCAKDRDAEDLRKERLEEEIAKTQAIAGTYGGFIRSSRIDGGKAFVSIQIQPDTAASPGQVRNEERAAITATLSYFSTSKTTVLFHEGTYDPDRNTFLAKSNLGGAQGAQGPMSLRLSGKLEGGKKIRGELSVEGASSRVAFDLDRDATLPADFESETRSRQSIPMRAEKFVGDKTFGSTRVSRPVELWIIYSALDAKDSFLYIFTAKRMVDAILHNDYKDGTPAIQLNFEDSILDNETGALYGQSRSVYGANKQLLTLRCQRQLFDENTEGWTCLYITNIGGWISEIHFRPVVP